MNRLSTASSLYLRQHASNPVDWWQWGDAAFAEARRLNRPLFLSIGYSSCHWCHVMAHESFENPELARLINALFVAVKVDREERPDVDRLYMDTVIAMTGRGGWPMSVFLDPHGVPIFAGTYFPPQDRYGMPGFGTVLESVARAFRQTPDKIAQNRTRFFEVFGERSTNVKFPFTTGEWQQAQNAFRDARLGAYDIKYGGYGEAPKFPPSGAFESLYRMGRSDPQLLSSVRHTLRAMCDGGLRDQVRGGFHRYSTDMQWLVPHFEKMLYDQSTLLEALLYESLMPDGQWAVDEAAEVLGFLLRDMQTPSGFASALDADDALGEGHFYTFTHAELKSISGTGGLYVPSTPNFEDRVLLTRAPASDRQAWYSSDTTRAARNQLLDLQAARAAPACDPKVLVEWNAHLAIQCYAWFMRSGDRRWWDTAQWIDARLAPSIQPVQGRTQVLHIAGQQTQILFLEDCVATAGSAVARASAGETSAFAAARELLRSAITDFVEGEQVYAATPDPLLPVRRPAPLHDAPTPPAAVMFVRLCLRVGTVMHDDQLLQFAQGQVPNLAAALRQYPMASAAALEALRELLYGPEIMLVLLARNSERPRAEAMRPGVWTVIVEYDNRRQLPYTAHINEFDSVRYLHCSGAGCGMPSTSACG